MKMMTTTTTTTIKWESSEWFKKWEMLSKENEYNKPKGKWNCYFNNEKELIYEYVDI